MCEILQIEPSNHFREVTKIVLLGSGAKRPIKEGAVMDKMNELPELGNILIYQNEKGDTKIDVYFREGDIWMNQASIAKLYNTTPQNVTMHIKNIYADGELDMDSTCKDFLQVQIEGTRQQN